MCFIQSSFFGNRAGLCLYNYAFYKSYPSSFLLSLLSRAWFPTPFKQNNMAGHFCFVCVVGTPHRGCPVPTSLFTARVQQFNPAVRNDHSRTGLCTFVYNTRSVHTYYQNKVSILLLVVLITSYCARSSTVSTKNITNRMFKSVMCLQLSFHLKI